MTCRALDERSVWIVPIIMEHDRCTSSRCPIPPQCRSARRYAMPLHAHPRPVAPTADPKSEVPYRGYRRRSELGRALLLLAGASLPRRLPCRPRPSPSQRQGLFALSKGAPAPLKPRRSPLSGTPITALANASNCRFQVEYRSCPIPSVSVEEFNAKPQTDRPGWTIC